MNSFDIQWLVPEEPWANQVEEYLQQVCTYLGIDNWEVSLTLCDDSWILQLNSEYRGKDEATDVLSFPQLEGEGVVPIANDQTVCAGDLVVSLPSVRKNAEEFRVPFYEELRRVLIHGILHLKGLEHSTNEEMEPMLLFQEEILGALSSPLDPL